jgi:hypothetical protein
MKIFMMDVESIGLHGRGYAVAWLVIDTETGEELDSRVLANDPADAWGDVQDRRWVTENVPPIQVTHKTRSELLTAFWADWMRWRAMGAILAADCPWPVESRFLAACIDQTLPSGKWSGPYPILDVVSVRLGAGESLEQAMESGERLPRELPVHNPLADCRQSARLLLQALKR